MLQNNHKCHFCYLKRRVLYIIFSSSLRVLRKIKKNIICKYEEEFCRFFTDYN